MVFVGIAVAAGVAGGGLLAFPSSTARFFSWGLAPPPVAALAGGLYLASTATYLPAATRSWREGRGLIIASLALTVPTLVATLIHLEVFDFSRPLAVAWLVIFTGAPPTFVAMLGLLRPDSSGLGERRSAGQRIVLSALTLGYAAVAVALLLGPAASSSWLPFDAPPMSGRFVGAWATLLAVLAAWTAIRPSAEGLLTMRGLALFPLGALAGAVRTFGDLGPPGRRAAYLVVLSALCLVAATLWLVERSAAEDRSTDAGESELVQV